MMSRNIQLFRQLIYVSDKGRDRLNEILTREEVLSLCAVSARTNSHHVARHRLRIVNRIVVIAMNNVVSL
jgi:hypothetical protein